MHRSGLAATLALALLAGSAGVSLGQPAGPPPGPSKDPAAAPAGSYKIDPLHASVIARATHLGLSHFAVRFNKVDGHYAYDPAHPLATKVDATVDATSVDINPLLEAHPGVSLNDHFVKERDLAGGSKTPVAHFVSTSIQAQGNHGTMTGDLTLNGVTKPVAFDVTFNGTMPGMGGGAQRMGFTALATIKRSDFGILPQMPAFAISDDVNLDIEAEFTRQP